MSQQNDTGCATVVLTEAVGLYKRTDASGTLCGITERGIGYAREAGAIGDAIGVYLHTKPGTVKVVANGAISKDAICYSAADGEVGPSASTAYPLGIAMEAAAADQDVIEMMPLVGETAVA